MKNWAKAIWWWIKDKFWSFTEWIMILVLCVLTIAVGSIPFWVIWWLFGESAVAIALLVAFVAWLGFISSVALSGAYRRIKDVKEHYDREDKR